MHICTSGIIVLYICNMNTERFFLCIYAHVHNTTTKSVVAAMKSLFARHDIPDVIILDIILDNNSQCSSQEFQQFAKDYEFIHLTSSLNYPQGNGEAMQSKQSRNYILKRYSDHNLALLLYRYNAFIMIPIFSYRISNGRVVLALRLSLVKCYEIQS